MEESVGIKIEGPSDNKTSAVDIALLTISTLFVLLTLALLLIEFLNIKIPMFWTGFIG